MGGDILNGSKVKPVLAMHRFLSLLMLTALMAAVALLACTSDGAEVTTDVVSTTVPTPTAVPTTVPTPTAIPTAVLTPTAIPTAVPTPKAVPTPAAVPTPTAPPTPILTGEVTVVGLGSDKQTITFADLNWTSALLQNRIAQYIVEHGYGYPTDVKFGATLPLFEGLQHGDSDVAMEIWLPNRSRSMGESP